MNSGARLWTNIGARALKGFGTRGMKNGEVSSHPRNKVFERVVVNFMLWWQMSLLSPIFGDKILLQIFGSL